MKKMTKKFVAVFLAAVLCLSIAPFAMAGEDEYIVAVRGDANCDGTVNSTDALEILLYAVGKDVDDNFSGYWADVNGDENINSSDALRALQIAVGAENPMIYSDAEILKYYSDALSMSCQAVSQISYETYYYSVMVNDYDSEDWTEFEEDYGMDAYYVNGRDEADYTAFDFCPSTWIPMDAVSDVSINGYDGYYEVTITLNEEWTDYENYVPHNTYWYTANYADCTYSGFEDYYAFDGNGYFPESTIVACISYDGYVTDLFIDIPFELHMSLANNYSGEYLTDVTENGFIADAYYFYF